MYKMGDFSIKSHQKIPKIFTIATLITCYTKINSPCNLKYLRKLNKNT